MKIVFLSYLHGFGGAERQNVMLANAMAEKGHDVTLVSISADNNCYDLGKRVKYKFVPDRTNGMLRVFTRYIDIKRIIKKIKPDIIVNFWFQSAYLTALMSKAITGKVIYSERGDPSDKEYSGALGIIRKLTLFRIDGFVFQSKGARDYFDEKIKKRSIVIPNPVFVKASDFPIVKERRKAIVTIGRLHPQKNQKLLIKAFALIAEGIPNYTLEIYGDGELESELKQMINRLGMSNRIILKGTSKEIHKLVYDASTFVLSSDYEGMPNTLIEAMALGIPSVSTDYSPKGVNEIITDGIDGLIVPRRSVKRLAKAIYKLIKDEKLRERISENCIKISNRLSPDNVYESWNQYFIQVKNG